MRIAGRKLLRSACFCVDALHRLVNRRFTVADAARWDIVVVPKAKEGAWGEGREVHHATLYIHYCDTVV